MAAPCSHSRAARAAVTPGLPGRDNWGTGYSGQYTIANPGTSAVTGWTLGFTLPAGTSLSSLWNGTYTVHAGQVTVTSDDWDATIRRAAR